MSEPYPPPPDSHDQPGGPQVPDVPSPPSYASYASNPTYANDPALSSHPVGTMAQYTSSGPVGQVRSTGICILLAIVTLGIYPFYWYYKVHSEMKAHSGQGIGGPVALILAIFVGIVNPYITSSEVGGLYTRSGQNPSVTGLTGLWYFPGIFIIVGPLVWFVKTNGALNSYWESKLNGR